MKTVRAVNTKKYGHSYFDIVDEYNDMTGNVAAWIIDNEYFVATRDCPRFDPRDGSPLQYDIGFKMNDLIDIINNLENK